jgi:sulfur carrier protein
MKLNVSGVLHEFQDGSNVEALVKQLGTETGGIAVAVNDRIVRKSAWSEHKLIDGDRIEIVKAVQGG